MSLTLPFAMRDAAFEPLAPPKPRARAVSPAEQLRPSREWFENGFFEIDRDTGAPVDSDDPRMMVGANDTLEAMLEKAVLLVEGFKCGFFEGMPMSGSVKKPASTTSRAEYFNHLGGCWDRMRAQEDDDEAMRVIVNNIAGVPN